MLGPELKRFSLLLFLASLALPPFPVCFASRLGLLPLLLASRVGVLALLLAFEVGPFARFEALSLMTLRSLFVSFHRTLQLLDPEFTRQRITSSAAGHPPTRLSERGAHPAWRRNCCGAT